MRFLGPIRKELHERGLAGGMRWAAQRAWLRSPVKHIRRVKPIASEVPLEVIVPCGPRDLDRLPVCLDSIERFIRHPILRVQVLTNRPEEAADWIGDRRCDILPDDAMLSTLQMPKAKVRGSILQQILKLAARRWVSTRHYLVVDADTVFLKPRVFEAGGRMVLRYTDRFNKRYCFACREVMPEFHRFPVSFVAHHMAFDVDLLDEAIAYWERQTGLRWLDWVVAADRQKRGCVSEYELYANYTIHSRPDSVRLEYWRGVNVEGATLPTTVDEARAQFPNKETASYHWFLRPEYTA